MNNKQSSPAAPTSNNTLRVKLASHDSFEDAINSPPDEPFTSSGNQTGNASSSDESNQERRPIIGSGHLDRKQRQIYLGLFMFSGMNALIGLILLLTWMLHYRPVTGFGLSDKDGLANLHPILMYTFMVSLNMYAVLIYRTYFKRDKNSLKWTHALVSGANILMSLLGVAAMFKAHLLGGMANFYSLHSWIGVLTNAFYLAQFLIGFVSFLKPGLKQQKRAKLMPWHRLCGTMLLVLASVAALTGICELVIFQDKNGAYKSFTAITFIANISGVAIILMTATSIYLLTAPQYLRPPTIVT